MVTRHHGKLGKKLIDSASVIAGSTRVVSQAGPLAPTPTSRVAGVCKQQVKPAAFARHLDKLDLYRRRPTCPPHASGPRNSPPRINTDLVLASASCGCAPLERTLACRPVQPKATMGDEVTILSRLASCQNCGHPDKSATSKRPTLAPYLG